MDQHRVLAYLLGAIVLCIVLLYSESALMQYLQARRDARFQAIVDDYTRAVPAGARRDQVESYLQTKGVTFTRSTCNFPNPGWCDIVVAGNDLQHPLTCAPAKVYVRFDFLHDERLRIPADAPDPSDLLLDVAVEKRLESCL
jgi:hypothetical protein